MGFRKVDEVWQRRRQDALPAPVRGDAVDDDDVEEVPGPSAAPGPSAPPSSPSPAPASASSLAAVAVDPSPAYTERLMKKMKEEMNSQLRGVRQLIYGLYERLSNVEDSIIKISAECFKTSLESISKRPKSLTDDASVYSNSSAKLQVDVQNAILQIKEMMNHFRKTQKDGMGEILEQLKRIFK